MNFVRLVRLVRPATIQQSGLRRLAGGGQIQGNWTFLDLQIELCILKRFSVLAATKVKEIKKNVFSSYGHEFFLILTSAQVKFTRSCPALTLRPPRGRDSDNRRTGTRKT